MNRILTYTALLLCILTTTSCDELLEMQFIRKINTLELSRKDLVIMKGDSCRINLIFNTEANIESAFWNSLNPTIAAVKNNGLLMAKEVGTTQVNVTTVQSHLKDSCRVQVINSWDDIPCSTYPHDMVVYADVRIDGKVPNEDLVLVAMCDKELRGYGKVRTDRGITYTYIRIWSPNVYGDQITFFCYDHTTVHLQQLPYTITFDGESHGTLSNLVPIYNK